MKKVITRVEFVWNGHKYKPQNQEYYLSKESFAYCGDDGGSSSSSSDQTNAENSFDDGSMASSMGQNADGSWAGSGYTGTAAQDANDAWGAIENANDGKGGPAGYTGASTYDEVSGDLGTSGRGGNVGGVTGPSGGVGVGGFGSPEGFDEAVSNYETDPGAWNSINNNYAGLDGPINADTFANWASRNGILSQVGAGQKGNLDSTRDFISEHPSITSLINMGLYAVNPVAGMLGSVFTNTISGRGGQSIGGTLGSMFAGQPGAIAGSFLGGLFDGKSTANSFGNLAASTVGYGLNATGLNFSSLLNSALNNDKGSLASIATNYVGNMAQNALTSTVGAGVAGVSNSNVAGPAGQSSLGTGISAAGGGSAIASSGFNLYGGLDNNGGTGQFDLNKGIVGGGLSALGAALLTGNNNMAAGINLGDLGSLGASLYGQYGDNYSKNLQGIASSADPTLYNNLLAQSYTDPKSVYDSQYAPMDKQFYGDMMANQSASGRTTDAYKTGVARESAFQNFLNQYRTGLSNTAQGRLNTYTGLQKSAATNTQDLKNTTANALSRLFGSNTVGGEAVKSGIGGLGNLFSQGTSSAGNWLSDLFNDYNSDGSTNGGYTSPGNTVDSLVSNGGYNGDLSYYTPIDNSNDQSYRDYMANLDRY